MAITISRIKVQKGGILIEPNREDLLELKTAIRRLMNDLRFKGSIDGRN